MKYLKTYNESSVFRDMQTYTGGNRRPALTAEIMKSIDDIHSGFNKQDIVDMFQDVKDEGIGSVGEVDFYYGIDCKKNEQGERWYGFSKITINIIIDEDSLHRREEYFKIRDIVFQRMRDMYNYFPTSYYYDFKKIPSDQPYSEFGDKIEFSSSRIYWITPRSHNESSKTPLSEIKLDIQDILLDLNDEGIITNTSEFGHDELEINLSKGMGEEGVELKPSDIIRWGDIKNDIERINKYLSGTNGWRIRYYIDSFGVLFDDNGVLKFGAELPNQRRMESPVSLDMSFIRFEIYIS